MRGGEECDVQADVGDCVGGVGDGGGELEVRELEGGGEDDFVEGVCLGLWVWLRFGL